MYEIAICDDDANFSAELRSQLREMFQQRGADCRVTLFSDPSALMSALQRGANCDLIFQDILFGTEKGVRFARLLRERKWDIDLVFVTTSAQYALAGYDVQPLNFLLKPVAPDRLAQVVDCFLERRVPQVLQLATPQGLLRVPLMDVLYFEIYNHSITVHLAGGGSRSWRGTLNDLEAELPPHRFVRTHRSYLVNLAQIAAIERGQTLLNSGESVPISKGAYDHVLKSMIAYDRRGERSV